MPGVRYALADFVTGDPIAELPVMEGAKWTTQVNRPDSLSCTVDLNDADVRRLDLRSSSEPNKTVLYARTEDDDNVLAWGVIGDGDRKWDEDSFTVALSATGIEDGIFGAVPIAPASALTAPLTVLDADGFPVPNPALDTIISGYSHGTIGKKLVEQWLAWPGAPAGAFILPPDELGKREQSYSFAALKALSAALDDLVKQEGGPDFAFDAVRASDGLRLRYVMRHGSEAEPRIGVRVGSWSIGGEASPISGLTMTDAVAAGPSVGFMSAGKSSAAVLLSRVVRPGPIANGYPPLAIVDTSRSDVVEQATLDGYNNENMDDAERTIFDLSFTVRGDAAPGLGAYRPGDMVDLDPPDNHPWHRGPIPIRIMSMTGDESGRDVEIGCVVLDA